MNPRGGEGTDQISNVTLIGAAGPHYWAPHCNNGINIDMRAQCPKQIHLHPLSTSVMEKG